MLDTVATLNDIATFQYSVLKNLLKDATAEELDWKIHPEAVSSRWIIGHLGWFEDYISDAIENTGLYQAAKGRQSYAFDNLDQFLAKVDKARDRRLALYEDLRKEDLERKILLVGEYDIPIRILIRVHAEHFSGHVHQIQLIRGTYNRAYGNDK